MIGRLVQLWRLWRAARCRATAERLIRDAMDEARRLRARADKHEQLAFEIERRDRRTGR
ncbi:hypothetical protein [Methylopila sp. Yamaguchi]|uniref:hypothetical protein n=1 Tax=Methylopila sp. Yamaguchi TaxID=1437817 RepID=UPI000CBFBB0D|nr:hypothetical protein [Methylopila sp. Yamaguchi]GBD48143.1 hypothetical protein METY_1356 [Methylopila sp. Yamaguchi]